MHVDRTMDVENRRSVGDLALGHANRDDRAAVFNGLAIDIPPSLRTPVPNRGCPKPASFTPGDKLVRPALRRAESNTLMSDSSNPAALSAFIAASAWGGGSYT